jgi:DNA polymerase-3 subunit beta
MKIQVNSAALSDAVNWATQVIPPKTAAPILAGIKIQASEGQLQLSAFDYERSARLTIDASVDEEGTILVQGKLLGDIAKNLPAENTTLETEGSRLHIQSGPSSSFNLQLMPTDEYPDMPAVPQNIGQIDGKTFVDCINQACVAIARDEVRPVLTGVHMQFKGDQVILNATDRFRLARTTFTWSPSSPDLDAQALVRGDILRSIARSVDTSQNVVIGLDQKDGKLMSFDNNGRVTTVQLIDGQFPAVDRLFADSYPIQATLDRRQLLSALHRVSLVAERNAPVRLAFEADKVRLSAGTADESQASEILPVTLSGDSITVAFNPGYLTEGLSAISEPFARIKMTTAVKAVEFNGQQEKDDEPSLAYRYLLVPMRFTD